MDRRRTLQRPGHGRLRAAALTAAMMAVTAVAAGQNEWRGITLGPEVRCTPYDSDDYRYSQRLEPQILERLGGLIYSPYTGERFRSLRETDIEHIVARSEAHDSGLCGRDQRSRDRFASDLDNLTLAAPRLNRQVKRHYDAAEWQPAQNRCWFAETVIHVRRKHGLTMDWREAQALDETLRTCP